MRTSSCRELLTIVTQRIKSLILITLISSENYISDTEVQTLSTDILSVVTQDLVPLLCEYDVDNENERSTQLKHTYKD